MSRAERASVVVNNYNYGRFLAKSIESALGQTYPNTEVLVVDDGSTDDSREVIAGYSGRIIPVLKENGGQASALNAGVRASRGEVVLFLDADDLLLPTAVEKAVEAFREGDVAKVHWPLWALNEGGDRTGQLIPGHPLSEGDLRETVLRLGPESNEWPPTTGNACARSFLEDVYPIPEQEYRLCADAYLFTLAPAYGRIRTLPDPQGCYRIHGLNQYWHKSFDEKLAYGIDLHEKRCSALHAYLRSKGLQPATEVWRENCWWHQVRQMIQELTSVMPPGGTFILVDDDQLGTGDLVAGRRRIPFLEKDGQYWGPPEDDGTAIRELERLRQTGARFIVFAWPAFWWLDYYTELSRHLHYTCCCLLANERLVAFALPS